MSEESIEPSPLIQHLRRVYPGDEENEDAGWKNNYRLYLIQQCHAVGLEDSRLGIEGYLETTQDLPFENCATDKEALNLLNILRSEPVHNFDEREASLHSLGAHAHIALRHFKDTLTPEVEGRAIEDFCLAAKASTALHSYHNTIGVFAVTEEEAFKENKAALYQTVLNYYTNYHLNKHLPDDFEAQYTHFLAAKERAIEQETTFINGAIPALVNHPESEETRRVLSCNFALSDEQLMLWKKATDRSITPYTYNRILLH